MKIPGVGLHVGTGGRFVAQRLLDLGVTHVFSLPGSQVLPIWDGWDSRKDISVIVPRNERSGAFMAEGYGKASGRPAVLMNTLGPGVANELLGVHSALLGKAPVLCVCPWQPPRKRDRIPEVFQGLDHPRFFSGSCKRGVVVEARDDLAKVLDRAYADSLGGEPGPVRVDLAFPLLFERRPRRYGKIRAGATGGTPAGGSVLIAESGKSKLPAAWRQNGKDALSPGIDEPGFAIPFALGAKFARPQTPVACFTDFESLMENLDSLAVAQYYKVPVRLAASGKSETKLAPIAQNFGLTLVPQTPSDPAGFLSEARDALTIVCG